MGKVLRDLNSDFAGMRFGINFTFNDDAPRDQQFISISLVVVNDNSIVEMMKRLEESFQSGDKASGCYDIPNSLRKW